MKNIFKKIKETVTGEKEKEPASKTDGNTESVILARKVPAGPRKTYADLLAEANEKAKANKEHCEAIIAQRKKDAEK